MAAGSSEAGVSESMLAQLLGKGAQKLEAVDLGAELPKLGLDTHFPREVWPPTSAVREMATWLRSRKRCGDKKIYVYVDKVCILVHRAA